MNTHEPLSFKKAKRTKYLPVIVAIPVLAVITILSFHFFYPAPKTSFPPPPGNKTFTVIIDAGHGGKDEGTKIKTAKEKNITLAVAKQIETLAPGYGINVILTRHNDTFMNPVSRVKFAMQQNADAFVSIHVNELRGYSYVSGMQVYVSGKNPDFMQSRLLGSAIAQGLGADFKISHTLQQRAENIYVLADNFMPSVLIECGFITNAGDVKMLTDSSKTLGIAKQILTGIAAYANHAAINAYAVQQTPSRSSRHKTVIMAASLHIKKAHHKSSKTA
ncbi:MAG TPA: N-acetylmuramoyl-L-alanine amidase [Chitinophagaceae bacterium]|nr:N-acetylmuramoyl-L-alanine amidase [Chitinophagaceae bacterium]